MQILVANSKGGCGKTTLVASLADVLNADVIDHDNQGTLRVSSSFTGRHIPISYEEVSEKIVLHDTPPYNSVEIKSLMKEVDLILIPCKLKYPDFLALRAITDQLVKLKITDKSVIVYNEVRKPYTNTYRELKELYEQNYPEVRKAKQELSNLVAYSRVLAEPLIGKALKEINALKKELNIC